MPNLHHQDLDPDAPLLTDDCALGPDAYEAYVNQPPITCSAGRGYGAWQNSETLVLEKAMAKHGTRWSIITKLYGLQMGNRNQVAIKDKARNEIRRRIAANEDLGSFRAAFRNAPGQ